MEVPWLEKYRPMTLDEIVGNKEAIERLKVMEQTGNMPHLILSGSPGIGKTTSIQCLARGLLGDAYKEGVLELNASDDRGIEVVRNQIKMFAQRKVNLPNQRHKIIILDEADSMTSASQQALRRIMETFSHSTRFVMACNTSSKIIEPIQSRCAILRYNRLSDEEVLQRVMEIIEKEGNIPHNAEGLEVIIYVADGDMRQAINALQATYSGFGLISAENVFKVCDQPHPAVCAKILSHCAEENVDEALQGLHGLLQQGYHSRDILTTLFRVVSANPDLIEYMKLEYMREIGLMQAKALKGIDSPLQLAGLVAKLSQVKRNAMIV